MSFWSVIWPFTQSSSDSTGGSVKESQSYDSTSHPNTTLPHPLQNAWVIPPNTLSQQLPSPPSQRVIHYPATWRVLMKQPTTPIDSSGFIKFNHATKQVEYDGAPMDLIKEFVNWCNATFGENSMFKEAGEEGTLAVVIRNAGMRAALVDLLDMLDHGDWSQAEQRIARAKGYLETPFGRDEVAIKKEISEKYEKKA